MEKNNILDLTKIKEEPITSVETGEITAKENIKEESIDYSEIMPAEIDENKIETEEDELVDQISTSTAATVEDYDEIFSTTQKEMEKLAYIGSEVNSSKKQLKQFNKALNIDHNEDTFSEVYKKFLTLGKKNSDDLTKAEVDMLLDGIKIDKSNLKLESDADFEAFKKSYLGFIISIEEGNIIYDNAQKELAVLNEQFNDEMNKLLSSLDYTEQLDQLKAKIEAEEDPKKKAVLQDQYNAIYSSISINVLLDKVKNKGYKILLKECRRDLDKTKAKAIKILKNDLKHSYMNPSLLIETLINVYGKEHEEGIKLLCFLFFKTITKRKQPNDTTHIFVNYFLLSVKKFVTKGFVKEESALYNTILDFLNNYDKETF